MKSTHRDFLASFILESDQIEGIYDDRELLKKQIDENHPNGHVGALLALEKLARENNGTLNHDVICATQGLITAEQHLKPGGPRLDEEMVGKYRKTDVSIAGRIAPHSLEIPRMMTDWINKTNEVLGLAKTNSPHDLICFTARLHFIYEFIHPFGDGNGRSGRALAYFMLRRFQLHPFIFTAMDRHSTYYRCFTDQKIMEQYFLQRSILSDA